MEKTNVTRVVRSFTALKPVAIIDETTGAQAVDESGQPMFKQNWRVYFTEPIKRAVADANGVYSIAEVQYADYNERLMRALVYSADARLQNLKEVSADTAIIYLRGAEMELEEVHFTAKDKYTDAAGNEVQYNGEGYRYNPVGLKPNAGLENRLASLDDTALKGATMAVIISQLKAAGVEPTAEMIKALL